VNYTEFYTVIAKTLYTRLELCRNRAMAPLEEPSGVTQVLLEAADELISPQRGSDMTAQDNALGILDFAPTGQRHDSLGQRPGESMRHQSTEPCRGVTRTVPMPEPRTRNAIRLTRLDVMFGPFRAVYSWVLGHSQGDALGYLVLAPSGRTPCLVAAPSGRPGEKPNVLTNLGP
jgi:hypothetical protein